MGTSVNHVTNTRLGACAADSRPYALGYSEAEFRRLEAQGGLFRDLTVDILRRAGLKSGMSVLDVGCGVGDVSLLAGELVGPSGLVLGIDRSADAVDMAERRATSASMCHWVRFAAAEVDEFSTDKQFDAVIGRLVLMYLPSPSATLARLARHLRPGGVIAFQEISMHSWWSNPDGPRFRQYSDWIMRTFERAGFELDMGGRLYATFVAAGLPEPDMTAGCIVGGGTRSPIYDYMAALLCSLLPAAERLGVATAAEICADGVAERLRAEAVGQHACIALPSLVGAWTRIST